MSTFRARILAQAGGVAVHNVVHVSAGQAADQDIAHDLADAWRARIVPILHSSYGFQGVEVQNIATEEVGAYSAGTTGPTQGGDTQVVFPTWVCASVRLRTARRGRSGAGRIGLGPIPEIWSGANGNSLTSDAVNLVNNAVGALITDLASSTRNSPMNLAVVSYYKGVDAQGKPIKRATPIISPVEGHSVNSLLGSRLSRHPNR